MIEIKNVVKSTSKITKITKKSPQPVYDITVRDTHRINANGFYTSNCSHPEIETFIHIKRDRIKVTGANVSIRFTDEFMRAVEADTEFTLRWPVDVPVEKASIIRVVRARDIWEQVVDAAWDSAEPGVLFWDTALERTPAEAYASKGFKTTSTNPCVTWETKVAVADGRDPVEIGKLAEEGLDVPVYAVNSKGKIVVKTMRHPRLTGHQVPIFKVTIEGGHTFKATGNHKMILRDGSYCEVKDLVAGDQLWVGYQEFVKTEREQRSCVAELLTSDVILRTLHKAQSQGYKTEVIDDQVFVSRICEQCGKEFVEPYSLREGAFCSDSCASLYITTRTKNEFYETHDHRCVISVEAVGFEDVYNGTVDDEHTFCFAVGQEKIERFEKDVTLLLGSRQCGEILLSPLDSCRLLIIDPTHFVVESYSKTAYFDWPSFNDTAIKAQRLMDDLVDLEIEAIDKILAKIESDPEPEHVKSRERDLWIKIKSVAQQGRRTGLGLTAVGDTLAMMGYRYGSPGSIKFVENLYQQLCVNAYESSIQMAEERGPFAAYEYDLEKDHPFIKQVMEVAPHLVTWHQTHGRRNIALLTTAPVGSISTMTQTTSGIEPVFKVSYTRRKKINDVSVKPDYIDDLGDKWSEYEVYHHGVNLWRDVNPDVPIDQNPYVNSESNQIDWEASVDLQAAAQKWICHSISKTCNLPKNVSHEVVNNVYLRAWKMGCKGFTVYRDGSRSGVLVESGAAKFDLDTRLTGVPVEELNKTFAIAEKHSAYIPAGFMQYLSDAKAWLKKQSESPQNAPKIVEGSVVAVTSVAKRPKELPCDIHRVNVKGESYLVFVGLFDDKPYEIFCGLADQVDVPKKVKRGTLIKNGRNAEGVTTYNLSVPIAGQAGLVYKDIVTLFDNPVYGAFSRTISLALRHKIPLSILVSQLRKDKNSDITSFSSVIARVLSKGYITDGTRVVAEKCLICGSTQIQYQAGCPTCMACGNSKCG